MADPQHRIEMIDTEINVLRMIWQDPTTTLGQSHLILKYTMELLREQRELEDEIRRDRESQDSA